MNFLKYIWVWFRDLFVAVGEGQPPSTPTLVTRVSEEAAAAGPPDEGDNEVEAPLVEVEYTLPKEYSLEDFECVDGSPVPADYYDNVARLATNLQILALELGKPVEIYDGFRTAEFNKHIGGSKKSTHLTCLGADIKVKGMRRDRLAQKIRDLIQEGKMEKGGVGVYPDCVHYDVRGRNYTWSGNRTKK